MSYFTFLGYFIGIPLLVLIVLAWHDHRAGRALPSSLQSWPFAAVVFAHVLVAVLYTTPWDNYLVATNVWWYDPALVTGIVLGWVPIEEYTFFVVQTLFTSLWLLALARRLPVHQSPVTAKGEETNRQRAVDGRRLRFGAVALLAPVWLAPLVLLLGDWQLGTYLALELVWALPPILFQLGFGADILWQHRRLVFWSLVPTTLYLAATDTVAIGSGTWTIDPAQSTGILIGTLPIEELIFFLVTNTLVVFGTILVLAKASQERVSPTLRHRLRAITSTPQQQMISLPSEDRAAAQAARRNPIARRAP